jgi:tripeptide aminopeptidase
MAISNAQASWLPCTLGRAALVFGSGKQMISAWGKIVSISTNYRLIKILWGGALICASLSAGAVVRAEDYSAEMAALDARASIVAARAAIQSDDALALDQLIELTEIAAPPFMEQARAARFAEMLLEAGADSVSIDEMGNVIARRNGSSDDRVVAVSAHLDTVFPEGTDVTVREQGGRYYAPGVGDDTRGLVVLLSMLRAMEAAGIKTEATILLVGSVGEEGLGNLRGVRHLFGDGDQHIDSFIGIDGGGVGRIAREAVGSNRYRVTFRGTGGHSWGNFGHANPHHAMGRFIEHLTTEGKPVTMEGNKSSYNIGRMGGGTSINSIPFESWAEVDMRSTDPARLAAIDAVFQAVVGQALNEENEARRGGEPLSLEVEVVGLRPAGNTPIDTPLVQRTAAAMALLGVEAELVSGSTDSNIPMSLGIPALTMGHGGDGGGTHTPDEWWDPTGAQLAVEVALLTLISEAGLVE